MSTKTKTKKTTFDLESIAAGIGFTAMSAAAVMSLIELEHVRTPKLVPAAQPAYAAESHEDFNSGEELMRREKEENAHSMVSYGTTMRSHPTSGRG